MLSREKPEPGIIVSGYIYPGKNDTSGGAGQGVTLSILDAANSLPHFAH
jgi:hypothetical protein